MLKKTIALCNIIYYRQMQYKYFTRPTLAAILSGSDLGKFIARARDWMILSSSTRRRMRQKKNLREVDQVSACRMQP